MQRQPEAQLYPHPANPLPRNARAHSIITDDGTRLRAMSAYPERARGTILLMGGRADYIERYFETAQDLIGRGYAVVTFDWRGQGLSQRLHHDRLHGHAANFAGYDDDLQSILTQIVLETMPGPYYALGHSTGGHVLLRALRHPAQFEKAVITSPLLGFNYGKWPRFAAHLLARAAVTTGLGGAYLPGFARGPFRRHEFDDNLLTSDPQRWDRDITTLDITPELGTGGPTFGWFNAAVSSLRELHRWKRKALIACPVLLVASGREWVVNGTAARDFATRVPGISYIQITGSRHEILMERNEYRDQFWSAFDNFMEYAG
jgi:lysophospholipase